MLGRMRAISVESPHGLRETWKDLSHEGYGYVEMRWADFGNVSYKRLCMHLHAANQTSPLTLRIKRARSR